MKRDDVKARAAGKARDKLERYVNEIQEKIQEGLMNFFDENERCPSILRVLYLPMGTTGVQDLVSCFWLLPGNNCRNSCPKLRRS
jgi:hypothetical protein